MISKTIGFRGTLFSDTPTWKVSPPFCIAFHGELRHVRWSACPNRALAQRKTARETAAEIQFVSSIGTDESWWTHTRIPCWLYRSMGALFWEYSQILQYLLLISGCHWQPVVIRDFQGSTTTMRRRSRPSTLPVKGSMKPLLWTVALVTRLHHLASPWKDRWVKHYFNK